VIIGWGAGYGELTVLPESWIPFPSPPAPLASPFPTVDETYPANLRS
jgi:hypothetical protein